MRIGRIALFSLCLAAGGAAAFGQQAPSGLRTEYLENPMGVDAVRPRFSWVLEHAERGQKQSAFQILVSQMPEVKTGEVWDSGQVASADSTLVPYNGKPLASGQRYYWKVRYWDSAKRPSPLSEAAWFEMGLTGKEDWKGKWITGANQVRKEFTLKGSPVRARAYVSGLGYYELRINGQKVGDRVLDPAWTTYDRRVLYSTYDVTPYLRQGANVVAAALGQGWYGARAMLLQMNIDTQGGEKRLEVATDATWTTAGGPVTADSVHGGETYDARLETPGWDLPGFKSATPWRPVSVSGAPPKGEMSSQTMPPIRVIETITPLAMTSPRAGAYVFDLGQNVSGWVRLRVRGPAGTAVTLRHGELLYPDGSLNTENLRGAKATDVYILKGGGEEEYEPRFTYHGFRYVEVTGLPATPRPGDIVARVVHSDVRPAGGFAASNPVLNRIQRMVQWGVRTNLHGIPTESNQRDERMGWLGDAHLAAESAIFNYDMGAFYTNFLRNIRDVQMSDGTIPDTVPYRAGRRPADPAWGAAYPLLAWYLYLYYGDTNVLEQHYAGIKAWTDYLTSRAKDGIVGYYSYGDWVSPGKTPGDLVSTFYYCYSVDILTRAAMVLGRTEDAVTYQKLGASIRDAFHRTYFNTYSGTYGSGSQTSLALPLFLDMMPEGFRATAMADLAADIVYGNNAHLSTGVVGTKYLFPLLTRSGRSDLAYDLAAQTTYPSWGYMAENGATTMWEVWQLRTGPSANSHNHAALASIGAWFYTALAGINPDAVAPGFQRIRFEPQAVRDLKWASGSMETPRGVVSSAWTRDGDRFRLEINVPVGSDAEVRIPKFGRASVTVRESGKPVWAKDAFQPGVAGVSGAKQAGDAVVVEAGSGRYVFEVD